VLIGRFARSVGRRAAFLGIERWAASARVMWGLPRLPRDGAASPSHCTVSSPPSSHARDIWLVPKPHPAQRSARRHAGSKRYAGQGVRVDRHAARNAPNRAGPVNSSAVSAEAERSVVGGGSSVMRRVRDADCRVPSDRDWVCPGVATPQPWRAQMAPRARLEPPKSSGLSNPRRRCNIANDGG